MMSTLHRYIARLYLVNVASMLVLLAGFVVTIDVIVNLKRFAAAADRAMAAAAEPSASGALGAIRHAALTALLVIDLWWPRLLQLFGYLLGVVLVAAMGFTCAQLVRHREFVAMLAGGISLRRLTRPFLAVALLFTAVQAINLELAIPRVAHLLTRQPNESGRREAGPFRVRLAPDAQHRLFSAERFDPRGGAAGLGALEKPWIVERDASGRVLRTIEAARAEWDGSAWRLIDGRARAETNARGAAPPATSGADAPIDRIDSSLDPTRLKVRYLQGFGQNLSWRQISSMLAEPGIDPRERERLERLRWGRAGALVSNLVTLLAALPFFLRREPGPMIGPALRAAPVALAGLAASAMSATVAVPGLPVALGVFIPALVLLPVAVALHTGIRT